MDSQHIRLQIAYITCRPAALPNGQPKSYAMRQCRKASYVGYLSGTTARRQVIVGYL